MYEIDSCQHFLVITANFNELIKTCQFLHLRIRAKSLRSALTTSRTQNSGRRKKVQFADAFGLNLVHQNYYDADDDFAMKYVIEIFKILFKY